MTTTRTMVVVSLWAIAALASGCEFKKKVPPNLALACETRQCICTEVDEPFFQTAKKVPVEWKSTGEAFCLEGYVLKLTKDLLMHSAPTVSTFTDLRYKLSPYRYHMG